MNLYRINIVFWLEVISEFDEFDLVLFENVIHSFIMQ